MERRVFLKTAALAAATQSGERQSCDVFVYESTPGGMAASGLSTTDAVRTHLFGGLVTAFVAKVFAHYRSLLKDDEAQLKRVRNGWFYEPSVAEEIFRRLIEGEHARLRWLPGALAGTSGNHGPPHSRGQAHQSPGSAHYHRRAHLHRCHL